MPIKTIPTKRFIALSAMSLAISAANIQLVNALPGAGIVTSGTAAINSTDITTTIDQTSETITIEWDSFNIAGDESVHFSQPLSSSIAINRISGGNVSNIFGKITSNGQVFLSNPNGFLFGAGSSINTGSFLATTSDMNLSIDGKELVLKTPSNAEITFEGGSNIITNTDDENGGISANSNRNETFIAVFSPSISNVGNLTAKNSSIILSDRNIGTIKLYGLDDIGIDISSLEASQLGVDLSKQTGMLLTGTDSYIALTNTDLTTLIHSAIKSPTELTEDMFTDHLADYDINIYGESLTLQEGNPVFPQLTSERTLTFTATDELTILSTIQDRKLNIKLDAKNITIGGESSTISLGGNNGLKSIEITTSGTSETDGLHLYSGMKAIDDININTSIIYHGNTNTDEIIFSAASITFNEDFKTFNGGIGDDIIFESDTLNLASIEGLGGIEFNSDEIWLNSDIHADTIKTTGGGNLYLMDNITLFSSDIDFRNINIASLVDNTMDQGYSLTLNSESKNANFTLYNLQDNALIQGPGYTILKELAFKSSQNDKDSRLSLSGNFSTESFTLGGETQSNFELNLSGDLKIKSLKSFDTQYATTNGIYNFNIEGDGLNDDNTNTAKLGKISDSTTLNSVSISNFNDISLYGNINVSSGDINIGGNKDNLADVDLSSNNKISINSNSNVLNIGNNSNGKITLIGDIQTTDGSGLQINTVNGHIEVDGISETGKLKNFTISKTLVSEGSVKINRNLYATEDITLKDLGDVEFSGDTTISADEFHSTKSHLKNDSDLTIETSTASFLGKITAKNISITGLAETKSESNLNNDITATGTIGTPGFISFLNTDILLQSNISLTGDINFLDEALTKDSDSETIINKPTINGNYALTLNAENSDIHVYKFGDNTALRSLSIEGYGAITFDDKPIINNLGNGSGGLSLLGDLNFDVGEGAIFDTSGYDGYLDFSGATLNGKGSLTFNTGSGDLTLGTIGNDLTIESLIINSTGKLNLYGDITLTTPTYDFSSLSAVEIYKDMTFGSVDSLAIVTFDNATLDGTFSLTLFSDKISLGTIGSNKSLQDLTIHSNGDLIFDNDITMVGTANISADSLMLNNVMTNTGKKINLSTAGDLTMSEDAVLITENNDINLSSTTGSISIATINAFTDVNIDAMGGSIFNNINNYVSNTSTSTNVTSDNLNLNALNQIGKDVKSPIVIDILNGGGITAEANGGIYIANRNNAHVSSRSLVIDSSTGGESAAIDAYSQFKLSSLNQINTPTVTTSFGLINNLAWQADEEESIRKVKTPVSAPSIYYSRKGWRLGY